MHGEWLAEGADRKNILHELWLHTYNTMLVVKARVTSDIENLSGERTRGPPERRVSVQHGDELGHLRATFWMSLHVKWSKKSGLANRGTAKSGTERWQCWSRHGLPIRLRVA